MVGPARPWTSTPAPWTGTTSPAFEKIARAFQAEGARQGVKIRMGCDFNRDGIVGNDKFIDWPHVEIDE